MTIDQFQLEAKDINVWFGERQVLKDVSLQFPSNKVTALIGPSGCGKSTFIRTLNRMHELIPSAGLAGSVLLDGQDIYEEAVTQAQSDFASVWSFRSQTLSQPCPSRKTSSRD